MTTNPDESGRLQPHELAVLEAAAVAVDVSFRPLRDCEEGLDPDLLARALADHAALCVVLVVQRGGPSDMRRLAISLDRLVEVRDRASGPARQFEEWARLLSVASARRGSSTADQTLRGWNGRTLTILHALIAKGAPVPRRQLIMMLGQAHQPIGDDSAMSHILRELEDAGLARRWKIGRESMVEATVLGRSAAIGVAPRSPQPSRRRSGRRCPPIRSLRDRNPSGVRGLKLLPPIDGLRGAIGPDTIAA